jgi:hypothetical protein
MEFIPVNFLVDLPLQPSERILFSFAIDERHVDIKKCPAVSMLCLPGERSHDLQPTIIAHPR